MGFRSLALVLSALSVAALLFVGPGRVTDPAAARAAADQRRAARAAAAEAEALTPATTTTVAAEDPVVAAAAALVAAPTAEGVEAAAGAMADSGNIAWVPHLVDMMRLLGGDTFDPIQTALATLTGVAAPADPGDAYVRYGAWLHTEQPTPAPGYVAWKAQLYGLVDPAFAELIAQVDDAVLASQLQFGGVRRGGIPELNAPATIPVDAAGYMTAEELTFGAVINGQSRSYPHRILDHHELANDVLGGEPVALANCTLCRTGVLYSRRVGDQILEFETSGLLRNSNKVMVDRPTNSLWNQLTGEAIAGPLTGTVLDRFPVTVTTYGDWIAEHPDTAVVAIPPGERYPYEPGGAYADYYATADVWFPVADVPDVFADKDLVATLDLNGEQFAVGLDALTVEGPQVLTVAGQQVVVVPTTGGARFYGGSITVNEVTVVDAGEEHLILADGATLPRLQSGHSFWFAWYLNFPDTGWWPAG